MDSDGSKIISFLLVILLIWGGYKFYQSFFSETGALTHDSSVTTCDEPANPYPEGSPEYAGFEAGRNGNDCKWDSNQSFVQGCERYAVLEKEYEKCISRH